MTKTQAKARLKKILDLAIELDEAIDLVKDEAQEVVDEIDDPATEAQEARLDWFQNLVDALEEAQDGVRDALDGLWGQMEE